MIDFESLKNKAKKQDKDYWLNKNVKKADLVSGTTKKSNNIRAFGGTGLPTEELTKAEQKAVDTRALNNMQISVPTRFVAGFAEGLSPFSNKPQTETQQIIKDVVNNSTAGKVGEVAGNITQWAIPYGATEKVAMQGGLKLANALGKGKAAQIVLGNAIQDATVGSALTVADAVKRQNSGEEVTSGDIAKDVALNIGLGAVISIIPGAAKLVGKKVGNKTIKSVGDVADLSDDEAKEAILMLPEPDRERFFRELKPRSVNASELSPEAKLNLLSYRSNLRKGNNVDSPLGATSKPIAADSNSSFAEKYGLTDTVRDVNKGKALRKETDVPYEDTIWENTDPSLNEKEFDDYMKYIESDTGLTVSEEDKARIKTLFYNIQTKGINEETEKEAERIADRIISQADQTIEADKELKAVRKGIKNMRIKLSDALKGELEYQAGKGARKAYFGNLTLAKDGRGIDEVYPELQELYGVGYFPDVESEGDQLSVILDLINRSNDDGIGNAISYETREEIVNKLLAGESVIPGEKTALPYNGETYGLENKTIGKAKPLGKSDVRRKVLPKNNIINTRVVTPNEVSNGAALPKLSDRNKPNLAESKEATTPIKATQSSKQTEAPSKMVTQPIDYKKKPIKASKIKDKFDSAYKALVNGANEITKLGKASGRNLEGEMQAIRTARGTTEYIFGKGIVNIDGKLVNEKSYKDLMSEIKDFDSFNEYAQHLHNVDRTKEGKPIWLDEAGNAKYTAEQSQMIVDDILEEHPEYKGITKNINAWWRQFTHEYLVNSGRWDEDTWKMFIDKYPNYIPTYRVDKTGVPSFGGKYNISAGSGVKEAKGGTGEVIGLEDNFLNQINNMVRSAKRNDLYLGIIEAIRSNPEELKYFGTIIDDSGKAIKKSIDLDEVMEGAIRDDLKDVKNGVATITAYVDGKPISANISKELAEALSLLEDAYGEGYLRSIGEVGKKITNPIKGGITGINPLFAVANMMRDFPTYLIQSDHPLHKTLSALPKAFAGMTGISPKYKELLKQYEALGGKQAGYYAQGKGFEVNAEQKATIWNDTKKLLSFLGETGETLPRFAEFVNSIEAGRTPQKALSDAAEVTVNFSRSGPVTKAIDGWVLYLNAAVQGIDKFARQVKSKPIQTLAKGLPLPILASVSMATCWDNPYYQDLTDRVKQNYYVFPNYKGEKDENGMPMTFLKFPMNREYGTVLASSLNMVFNLANGSDTALSQYGETIAENFLPPSPVGDNIVTPILNAKEEKGTDFAGRYIVPSYLQDKKPSEQKDAATSGVAKGVSKLANMLPTKSILDSPKKVDYLIDSYGGFLGGIAQSATTNSETALKDSTIGQFGSRFTADPRYSSGVLTNFYNKLETATQNKEDSLEDAAVYKSLNRLSDEISKNIKAERELMDNGGSKEAISQLRAERNELARTAAQLEQDARLSPTFYSLPKDVQDRYIEGNKEEWAKTYTNASEKTGTPARAMSLIDSGKEYQEARKFYTISEGEYNRAKVMLDNGITTNEIDKIYKDCDNKYERTSKWVVAYEMGGDYSDAYYEGLNISDKKKNAAIKLKSAGWGYPELEDIYDNANINGSTLSKNEIRTYINQKYGMKKDSTVNALYNLFA